MDVAVDDSGIDSDQCKMQDDIAAVAVHNETSRISTQKSSTAVQGQGADKTSDREWTAPSLLDERTSPAIPDHQILSSRPVRKSSELQRKMERQCANARRLQGPGVVLTQPTSKHSVVSRSRLFVPTKSDVSAGLGTDTQPLVIIDMDESEDEFASPRLTKKAQREISQQLIKDGYNLDLEPDDEDLDLIPPRPINERCICCNAQVNCGIQ